MKKTVLTIGFLTIGLMAADFSQLTTEELIDMRGTVAVEDRADFRAEMQSRVATMTAEEQAAFRDSRQGVGMGGQGKAGANQPTFEDFDADGDGKISQTELETARANRMAQNAEDGKALRNAGTAPAFESIDSNGDGSVDATEFQSHQTTQVENRVNGNNGQGGQGMGRGQMGKGQGQGTGQGMGTGRP
ncbi:MAG: DUF1104 domain-containing protein [Epsilonproteobacteria bacterium]|nr:DUF1104 domain-containing protein [Campylobacterota bacterium]